MRLDLCSKTRRRGFRYIPESYLAIKSKNEYHFQKNCYELKRGKIPPVLLSFRRNELKKTKDKIFVTFISQRNMPDRNRRKRQAKVIRIARKIHRMSAILLFFFFFFVAITSVLLGWKKHSGDYLMPETRRGTSADLNRWMPLQQLDSIALAAFSSSFATEPSPEIDRMDVRKDDGIVKFTFKNNFKEVQLDGATGDVLSTGVRRSDFIESIHDGSVLDEFFGTGSGVLKLLYSTIMGLGLLFFTITGFWLWYGPKRMKNSKK